MIPKIFHGCKILKLVTWPCHFQGRFVTNRLGHAMINLPTKFEVLNFTCYGNMKGSAKCWKLGGLGWLGVTQGHWKYLHLIERVLLAFHSNCVLILHHFWDIVIYWSKSAYLNLPHLYLVPLLGWCRQNFAEIFGIGKLESLGYRSVILGLADLWQTDRHTMTANTALA